MVEEDSKEVEEMAADRGRESYASPRRVEKQMEDDPEMSIKVQKYVKSETVNMVAARLNTVQEVMEEKKEAHVKLWVPHNDPETLWQLVNVIGPGKNGVVVKDGENEYEVEISIGHPHDETHDMDLDDVCEMSDLHEAPLLAMLRKRWQQDTIYTSAGNVLISINPYRETMLPAYPSNYDQARAAWKAKKDTKRVQPHIFAWAHNAYEALLTDTESQAIVVNGESGAGKTRASTLIVEYLTALSNSIDTKHTQTQHWEATSLLATTPVLEAFGNAKTNMNNNSSRFGKFVVLEYKKTYTDNTSSAILDGAHVEDFLLEKARVVAHAQGERNFHFFYQLYAREQEQQQSSIQKHKYLLPHDETQETKDDDLLAAEATLSALARLGCDQHEIEWLCNICKAIAVLGDIEVIDDEDDDGIILPQIGPLKEAAALLHIAATPAAGLKGPRKSLSPEEQQSFCYPHRKSNLGSGSQADRIQILTEDEHHQDEVLEDSTHLEPTRPTLLEALRHRSILVAGRKKLIPYTATQAMAARDALAKALYDKLFSYVVARCNQALRTKEEAKLAQELAQHYDAEDSDEEGFVVEVNKPEQLGIIGILDIYGFEVMDQGNNSLDQLLINYANESLQVFFNQEVLVAEIERYKEEGIEWHGVELQDATSCLDLIVRPPDGILVQLDEQVKLGARGSDQHFLGCIDKLHLNKNIFYSKPRFDRESFTISHFAAQVTYRAHGFLTRNVDPLSTDLAEVVRSSTDSRLASWYPPSPRGEGARQLQRRLLSESTSKKFRDQMAHLESELKQCRKHYVRCIRPNAVKDSQVFHMELVLRQLRFFGLLDIVRIRRLGYPERTKLFSFWTAYWRLLPDCPNDKRWQAFEDLLPKHIRTHLKDISFYQAYEGAIPSAPQWKRWARIREPLTKEIDALEDQRVKAAKCNDQNSIHIITAKINTLKLRLAEPSGEFAPPDINKAVLLLSSLLLEADEYAVGENSGMLYTKLGVTQRLDEMLARSMGLELSLAQRRNAELSELIKERVNLEAAATLQLQKIARARSRVNEFKASRQAANLLENRARALLARRKLNELRDEWQTELAHRLKKLKSDLDATKSKHTETLELVDAARLRDDTVLFLEVRATEKKIDAAVKSIASASFTELKSRDHEIDLIESLEARVKTATDAVAHVYSKVRSIGLERSRKAVDACARHLEASTQTAKRCTDLDASQKDELEHALSKPRIAVEGLKHRVFRDNRVASLQDIENANQALYAADAAMRATYLKSLQSKLSQELEARHRGVVAEAHKARVEQRDDVKAAIAATAQALTSAKRALGDAVSSMPLQAAAKLGMSSSTTAVAGKILKTHELVDAAEKLLVAEEDLFESTAKARALADLDACRAARIGLVNKARAAPGGPVQIKSELDTCDAALAVPGATSKSGAELMDIAERAKKAVSGLRAAVDRRVEEARAAATLQASVRRSLATKRLEKARVCARRLQALVRGRKCKGNYTLQKKAAVKAQARIRTLLGQNKSTAIKNQLRSKAALSIQSWWRAALASASFNFVLKLTRPWVGILPSVNEFVVSHTVVVWHKYTRVGRMGEVVGSRKLHCIVTSRGNILFCNGGLDGLSGVSAYNPESTPSLVRVLPAGANAASLNISLPNYDAGPLSPRRAKLLAGREQPVIITDPALPPEAHPVTKVVFKLKKNGRTTTMQCTDLAGTYQRWLLLKEVFENKQFSALTPKTAMRLNLDASIAANLPIDMCGRLYKLPFKRRIVSKTEEATSALNSRRISKRLGQSRQDADPFPPGDSGLPTCMSGPLPAAPSRASTRRISATIESAGVKHEEKERLFILQGGMLRYYKHEADDVPKGQLCLPMVGGIASEATVEPGSEPFQFTVRTHNFPEGITMRAHDREEMHNWVNAINAAIQVDLKTKAKMFDQKSKADQLLINRDS